MRQRNDEANSSTLVTFDIQLYREESRTAGGRAARQYKKTMSKCYVCIVVSILCITFKWLGNDLYVSLRYR